VVDIGLPTYSPPARSLVRVAHVAAILAAALVAASVDSISVDECRIVPGAFSNAFSSGFDVSRRGRARSRDGP
jgi:hypothetical protein